MRGGALTPITTATRSAAEREARRAIVGSTKDNEGENQSKNPKKQKRIIISNGFSKYIYYKCIKNISKLIL